MELSVASRTRPRRRALTRGKRKNLNQFDDARTTVDMGDRYAIEPAFVEYTREPLAGGRLDDSFSYASDTNTEWLDGPGLMTMIGEKGARRRRRTD